MLEVCVQSAPLAASGLDYHWAGGNILEVRSENTILRFLLKGNL